MSNFGPDFSAWIPLTLPVIEDTECDRAVMDSFRAILTRLQEEGHNIAQIDVRLIVKTYV